MENDCVFCKIVSGEIPKEFICENKNFVSFLDINPLVQGHTIVISKKHFETFLDMPSELGCDLLDCIKKTASKILKQEGINDFNIVQNNGKIAEQFVNHVHFHILPRRKGDGIKVVAEV